MSRPILRRLVAGIAIAASLGGAATAAELKVGSRADPTVDPHFLYLSTNMAFSRHIFDALVDKDGKSQRKPGLALSWTVIAPTVWEFKLRPGVKFHDGSDFTADDVVFTIGRVTALPNNPNPYTNNIRPIVRTEVVDPLTVRFHTDAPAPQLPGLLGNVFIVSRKAAEGALPPDFRSGKAAIGTGAYRFESYKPGEALRLTRNDAFWGAKPEFDKLTFRVIPNDAARVAALLAGDVDAIDYVPSTEVASLGRNPKVAVYTQPSDRTMYIGLDLGRTQSPFVRDVDGKELPDNPLRDARVRQAISMAIDRKAFVERVMEGLATVADQPAPPHIGGYNPDLPPLAYNPEGARALLKKAGYPNGFQITFHCPRDRWVNDAKLCQAVGQMLARIGLKMQVETLPGNVFFARNSLTRNEFSMWLGGWAHSSTGDTTAYFTAHVHTNDPARGLGSINRGQYSNPALDAMIMRAVTELDDAKRETLLRQTMTAAMAEMPFIPLHTQMTAVAARKGVLFEARADEQTTALTARSQP
ncbi:peptide/nickel transport system substrate-binding protein [Stella humosa]|uniref:Peptide/nickel transport system substrate-binding protein n=1 Tax=Stella humosa TaxID=94 RepID=A0A3N1KSE0_9PROT|nr:ABC transporter substrate-binding protein [Stella humosa]ROP81310.1 peptide/nickel transport system substrate-binding protein [Stella humosa]BBK32659.1 ABC transporter substrate-binding protein [Stella humosa]